MKPVKGLIAVLLIILMATAYSPILAQTIEEKINSGDTDFVSERPAFTDDSLLIRSIGYNDRKVVEGNQNLDFSIHDYRGVHNITFKIFGEEVMIMKIPAIDYDTNGTGTIEQEPKRRSTEPSVVPLIIRDSMYGEFVQCRYFDDQVAIYFENKVGEEKSSWMYSYISEIVRYVKERYGDIHSQRIYAIFYNGKHLGGHPCYYFDPQGEYQNVIYLGSDRWDEKFDWLKDAILHEIAHIVESTVHGRKGSPAFDLWGDSKWSEFFEYAFYQETGRGDDAQRRYRAFLNATDDFPRPGTHWFRDWFYPLWSRYGGSDVMREFYNLIAKYWDEGKKMNWGEFIHFMCGASQEDLRDLAFAAFGWTGEWETMFYQARTDYPQICGLYAFQDFFLK